MRPTVEQLIDSIFQQESGRGKADTSKPNYAGAQGPMQVTAPTFAGMKEQGTIPADWSLSNPEQAREAGNRHVRMLWNQYGGDPAKVAAAYYSGPKAVSAEGIKDFSDPKNPAATTTHGYVRSVLARMGAGAPAMPVATAAAIPTGTPAPRLDDPLAEVMPGRAAYPKGNGKSPIPDLAVLPTPGVQPVDQVAEAKAEAVASAALSKEEDVSFLEQTRRAWISQDLLGAAARRMVANDILGEDKPDPSFKLDIAALRDKSTAEQEFLQEATNTKSYEYRVWALNQQREDSKMAAVGGVGRSMVASLVAGLPLGAVSGLAAARTMSLLKAGSAAFMAQGRTAAAVGSVLAENAGMEVLMATAQAKIDPFFTTEDAVAQVGVGTLLGAAFGSVSLTHEGTAAPRLEALQDAQSSARLSQVLPEHADAQQAGMAAEAAALRAQEDSISRAAQPPESPVLPETVRPDFEGHAQAIGGRDQTGVDAADEFIVFHPDQIKSAIGNSGTFSRSSSDISADRTLASGYVVKEQEMGGGLDEWAIPGNWDTRRAVFSPGGAFETKIKERTGGFVSSLEELEALPAGVHAIAGTPAHFLQAMRAVRQVATQFIGDDFRIVIGAPLTDARVRGAVTNPTPTTGIIQLNNRLDEVQAIRTAIHEVAHIIWHKQLEHMPEGTLQTVDMAYQRMLRAWSGQIGGGQVARDRRFSILNPERKVEGGMAPSTYAFSRDEHAAEQLVKYIEDDIRANGVIVDRAVSSALRSAIDKVIEFITAAGRRLIGVEDEFKTFFDELRTNVAKARAATKPAAPASAAPPRQRLSLKTSRQLDAAEGPGATPLAGGTTATAEANAIVGDPELAKLGLDIAPVATPQQRAEVQAIKDLHDKAKAANIVVDEKRLSHLLDTAVFEGGQSNANIMLRSKNVVARYIAAMFVESPSGAAGRRSNASIAKGLHESAYLGNSINEVQFAYREYRQAVGGGLVEDTWGGKHWEEFNALVSRELESRGRSQGVTSHPAVVKGADALEAAYERMRLSQLEVKTVGWASLPETSKGYMPHRLSQEKIRNATNEQLQALHTALTDQFIRTQEFDASFSDMLASKYIDRVKHRALGGVDTPAGATHIGSSDVVEEALAATGMSAEQVRATMQRLMKAGPGHTKKRLQLDLNQTYATASGGEFKLGDLFEQDQFTLLRSQAARVSGEVALTQYGVYGKAGLDLLRRAMAFGEDGPASKREFEAFDQIAAEFLGTPYGTQSKVIDRVLQANAVSRLGGMGVTQFSEYLNGVVHVGVGRTLDAIVGIPRLLGEIKALARGEEVQNGILTGMEKLYGGAEFGTQSYKTVFPFDNKSLDPHSYGEETITLMDRLLRGASHMQAKLSFWRAIHSAQQRGMSEQIVRKAAVFLREGQSADVFLKDMGMSDDLLARMRAELPSIASWDAHGRLVELDVTKAADLDAAREFTQAVHRGVSQIIQGTFIGERSHWATDAHMRLLTQFRSFGLLAIEKQYGRQVGNVGEMKALGILLGSMCAVLPIYAARMQLQSLGREDREEFLDKAFEPRRVARQTMNYVAGSGLAPDFMDALGALAGVNLGGRQGDREQEFVGNVVAPAAGLLNDAWKAVQNVQEGETNLQPALKVLTNLPYLVPLINAMGD